MNALPSEQVAVLGGIDPDAYAASTVVSDYVSLAEFERLMAVLEIGDIVSTGTVDAKLRQATDASGTGVKDITGKSCTQLTQAGSDSNKQVVFNMRADELDVANGFTHVALSVTFGTAGCDASALLLGFNPKNYPASDNDISSVDEIVN